MAAVNEAGEILYRTKRKTPRSDDGDAIVEAFVDAGKECSANSPGELDAMSLAVPATVDYKKGIVKKAPNLPELDGVKLTGVIGKRIGARVIIENDANAAAVGENWLGGSKGFGNSIMVTLGTGVGGGLIIGGKLLRGIDGTAGEIGHICIEPDGSECGCGSVGCVEQYASATAIVRMAYELSKGGAPFTDVETLSSKDVYDLACNGNEIAQEVFRRQGFYLGILLAGLVNALNPEAIVIGGGAAAGWELFIAPLRDEINKRAYREPAERVKLVRAKLGDDAGILGAAFLALD